MYKELKIPYNVQYVLIIPLSILLKGDGFDECALFIAAAAVSLIPPANVCSHSPGAFWELQKAFLFALVVTGLESSCQVIEFSCHIKAEFSNSADTGF